jgi:thymidylate kinase
MKTSPEFSLKLAHNITDKDKQNRRKAYLGSSKKQDIHEKDRSHLANALNSFLMVAEKYPRDFKVIECLKNDELLPPDQINQKIIKIVSKKI